ncbi:MAG: hypothetical protein AAF363_18350 [Bacteroidota bacterium]
MIKKDKYGCPIYVLTKTRYSLNEISTIVAEEYRTVKGHIIRTGILPDSFFEKKQKVRVFDFKRILEEIYGEKVEIRLESLNDRL